MSYYLETVTGRMVDVLDPRVDDIDLHDIAWSLSRQARFNGHSVDLVPFSVAQHAVNVAKEVEISYPTNFDLIAAALHHDSAEYLISDIPSPVKHLPGVHEAIKPVEDKLISVICRKFGIKYESWFDSVIHGADLRQRAIEAHAFMFSRGKEWNLPRASLLELQEFERPWDSITAYKNFIAYHNRVIGGATLNQPVRGNT